ncbi:MAG: CAP domain-containing protein, partial [Chloroflexota bacterium]
MFRKNLNLNLNLNLSPSAFSGTRARIQTRAALLASAGILAAGLFGHGLGAAPSYSPDNQESAFLGLINEYRAQNGLGSLVIQDELGAAADFHSQDMATNDYFDHYLSDGSGPGDNIAAFGYSGDTWGENIAAGMATASEALVAWKNSPGHNAAMLDPDYSEIGIGRFYDPASEYGWYWTTTFGGGEDGAPSGSRAPRNTSTTTINESTLNGVDGSGDGRVTTTVNGRPVRGGDIVNADGEIITTVNNNGEAPIERTTTINEQPSVANGNTWDQSGSYDSYSAPADSYGNGGGNADTYTAADTYDNGGDGSGNTDTYAAADTYDNGGNG